MNQLCGVGSYTLLNEHRLSKTLKLHIPLSEGSEICSYEEKKNPTASDEVWALLEYSCPQMEILCCLSCTCLHMTYYPQWQAFKEIMFPWFPYLLTSIINNLLLVLKRKQVLIQILTQGVHIMSKSLILLCYWKGGNGSLLHFLFQTATIDLNYFIWNQYLEPKPSKLLKFCGNSSGKWFWEWSVNSRENQVG